MKNHKTHTTSLLVALLWVIIISDACAADTLICESWDFSYVECGSNIKNAWVSNQLSQIVCTRETTYGVRSERLWVSEGCRAEFEIEYTTKNLIVIVDTYGYGMVTSKPSGIYCDGAFCPWCYDLPCEERYPPNSWVTLTAKPYRGKTFLGWSGACEGTGNCSILMNQDETVSANFAKVYLQPVIGILLKGDPAAK